MTTHILRIAIALIGLFNVVIAVQFLIAPAKLGKQFSLIADGSQGLATLRADMTAFFAVAGLCALYGAWTRERRTLLVPILLFGIAITGRFVGLALDGRAPNAHEPMIAEAVMIAVLLLGYRVLGRRG